MKGTIHLINSEKHIGKILLDDGQESLVMTFPSIFEDGDRAQVKFQNNDPTGQVVNISIPGDEWNYGFIIIDHKDKPFGNILPTYPKMRNLLFFHKNELQFNKSDNLHGCQVKFKIRKKSDGKMSAVNIKKVDLKEQYRCTTPIFGSLELLKERVESGIVQKIVKSKKNNSVISGRVLFAKPNPNGNVFGFINRDDGKDNVYFKGDQFEKFYRKKPERDAIVHFRSSKFGEKISVKNFCTPVTDELLPAKKQYGIIDTGNPKNQPRFSLADFRNFYGREPEAGDIVYFYIKGNKTEFRHYSSETVTNYYLRGRKDNKYGMKCPEDTFENFVVPEPKTLYFAYSSNHNTAREVYRFNPEILSQAIACFKDNKIRDEFRLDAIEALLKVNYENKKIDRKTLATLRDEILTQMVKNALKNANPQLALEYECRRQLISYDPGRLEQISYLPGKAEFILSKNNVIPDLYRHEKWHIMVDLKSIEVDAAEENLPSLPYLLDPESEVKDVNIEFKEPEWLIDLNPPKEIKPLRSNANHCNYLFED